MHLTIFTLPDTDWWQLVKMMAREFMRSVSE